MVIFSLTALILYLSASVVVLRRLLSSRPAGWSFYLVAASAMLLHGTGIADSLWNTTNGQDMSLLNVASAVSLLISMVLTALAPRFNGWILLPVAYGFAVLLQGLNSMVPTHYVVHLAQRPELLGHIILALMAFSLLMIASLFALLLAYLDYRLKNRKRVTLPNLPPLLMVEKRVFQLILLGEVLLTLSLGTGLLFWQEMFTLEQAPKALLTLAAWAIYLCLLWGHYRHGWRGRTLITLSLSGGVLLTLAYFGNRFVNEILLH